MKQDENIYLSEYAHSMLDDELNTIVLAWIEKSGLTTEEEITNEISIDNKKVKNIIIKLFKNQLIEVTKDFLQTSFKGKKVIDTLKLSNEIVKFFYSQLGLKDQEEYFLNQTLHYYRNNYYYNYLNTCNSLKTWNRIIKSNEFKHDKLKFEKESFLVIIMHDLFQLVDKENINSSATSFKTLLKDFDCSLKANAEVNEFQSTNVLLDELYSINKLKDFEKYDTEKRELFQFLYFKDIFLSDEKTKRNFIIEFKRSKNKNINDHTFFTYTKWKDDLLLDTQFNFQIARQYFNVATKYNEKNEKDFLETTIFLLDNSNSIDDLATKTNKSLDEITELLSRIYNGIDKLKLINKTSK